MLTLTLALALLPTVEQLLNLIALASTLAEATRTAAPFGLALTVASLASTWLTSRR